MLTGGVGWRQPAPPQERRRTVRFRGLRFPHNVMRGFRGTSVCAYGGNKNLWKNRRGASRPHWFGKSAYQNAAFFDLPAGAARQGALGKTNRPPAGLCVRKWLSGYFVFSELALTTKNSVEFLAGSPSFPSGGCVVTMLTRTERSSTSHGTIPYTQACFMLLREDADIRGPEEK